MAREELGIFLKKAAHMSVRHTGCDTMMPYSWSHGHLQ
jgi:hypothetical protein